MESRPPRKSHRAVGGMRPAHGFEGACASCPSPGAGPGGPRRLPPSHQHQVPHAAPGAPLPRFSTFDREALRAAAENGWARGLAVPVARGGTRFGLVTLIGRGEEFDPAQRAYLCLISECLMTRIRSLGVGVDYALPPAGMSKREIEAVRQTAVAIASETLSAAKLARFFAFTRIRALSTCLCTVDGEIPSFPGPFLQFEWLDQASPMATTIDQVAITHAELADPQIEPALSPSRRAATSLPRGTRLAAAIRSPASMAA